MKIVRFAVQRRIKYGILKGEAIAEMAGNPFRTLTPTGKAYRLNEVRLLAPCLPSKIVCLGLNYRSHIEETHARTPEEPLLFIKPSTAVIGPEDNIVYPPSSTHIDYECELAVVIKKKASHVPQAQWADFVLGYTGVNDVTARDFQVKDKQWTRAKGFDTFAPVGPCIETELDPGNVGVETFVNGERKQHGNTSDLLFGVPMLVNFISSVMTLLPGDIISTGTPSGISRLLPGDTVEIKIEGIGALRNYVVKG